MLTNILLIVILPVVLHGFAIKRVLLHGDDIAQEFQSLQTHVQSLQSQVANLSTIVAQQSTRGRIAFSAVHDHLQSHIGLGQVIKFSKRIAFSAVHDHLQSHIGLGQVIKFSKVLLNIGHAYEPNTGVFTAPSSGVYQFIYFLGYDETHASQTWIRLMKNGAVLNAAVVDQMHSYQDVQGGNAAIVQLNAHDTVWIETWHENNAQIHGQYGFTSFSGFLL